MAERTGGETRPSGDVTARVVNRGERAPHSAAVRHRGIAVTARLNGKDFSVAIHGVAGFGGRTVTKSVDGVPDGPEIEALRAAMQAVADAYGDLAQDAALEAAYEARALAVRNGEDVSGEGEDDGR